MLEDIAKPAEDLAGEVREYVEMKSADAKLKAAEGLSVGLGRLCAVLVILMVLSLVLTTLSFGGILLIGKLLDNYAAGAFVVSGVFLIVLILLLIFRKKLFVNSFVKLFVQIFFGND